MSAPKPATADHWRTSTSLATFGPAIAVLAGVAAGLFAFRDVLTFEPHRPRVFGVEGSEALLFTPQGGSLGIYFMAAAWLVWQRRHELRPRVTARRALAGAALLLPVALLYGWSTYVSAGLLLCYILPLCLLGLGILLAGSSGLNALWRPALLLLVVAPLPGVLLNQIIFELQMATLYSTEVVIKGIGIATATAGDRLITPQGIFQVIETCSGMGTITTLLAATVIYTSLFETAWLRTIALFLIAPVIGFLVNGLRVVSLVLYPTAADSVMHSVQGLVAIVLGVCAIAATDALLKRVGRRSSTSGFHESSHPALETPPAAAQGEVNFGLILLPAITFALAGTSLILPNWEPPQSPPGIPHLPRKLGDWRSSLASPDRVFLGSVAFSEEASRRYERGDEAVQVLIGYADRLDPQQSLLSPKTEYPGSGWTHEASESFNLSSRDRTARASVFSAYGHKERRYVVHWREGISSLTKESVRAFFALDRGPIRRPHGARVIRLATPIANRPGGLATARQRIREFSEVFLPVLDNSPRSR